MSVPSHTCDARAHDIAGGIIGDFKYAPDVAHRELFDLPPDSMLLHSYSISFYVRCFPFCYYRADIG